MNFQVIKKRVSAAIYPVVLFLRSQFFASPARSECEISDASKGPLVVAGLFRTASGIGESARCCADALEATGLKVRRCDLSDAFGQTDLPAYNSLDGFPAEPAGTLILHLNAPETRYGLLALRYFGKRKWRIIGYWVWEFETLPPEWAAVSRYLTEIWTPSAFSAEAIRRRVDLPVFVAPHYVSAPELSTHNRFRERLPSDAIVTLIMGDSRSSHDRKNLLGGVKAFLFGVGDDQKCFLIIKLRNFGGNTAFHDSLRALINNHPRVRLIEHSISNEEKWHLVNACDIFLSLHRSEGFGLTLAEAMAMGKAVIATAWSGNMEFMTPDTACLVPYELVQAVDRAGVYSNFDEQNRWADPDLDFAAAALNKLCNDSALRIYMGECAAAQIVSKLDGSHYVRLLQKTKLTSVAASRT